MTSRNSTRSCSRQAEKGEYAVRDERSRKSASAQGGHLMFGIGNPELGVLMLALFVVFIMFGFPIAFTLMALGVFFGYFAMGDLMLQAARPAHLFGDDQRRADLDPAVRLHGLHHRARQHSRPAVPLAAARRRPGAGRARARDARDLRDLRHRHRHRRRRRHADGAAGVSGHAARRLRRQDRLRRGLRRRLPRHSDSAQRDAHSLRRHRRRLGGQALRRRLLPRPHAGRALHSLRRHHGDAQSEAGAASCRTRSATSRSRRC